VLHPSAGSSYTAPRASDAGVEQQQQRPLASPRSPSSSATSHAAHAYPTAVMTTNTYSPAHIAAPHHATGLGIGPSAGPPADLRLAVPGAAASQTTSMTSWHQPSAHYSSDLSSASTLRTPSSAWDYGGSYMSSTSPATGLPGSVQAYNYHLPSSQTMRFPSLTGPGGMRTTEHRFVPLHDYEGHGQPTTTS